MSIAAHRLPDAVLRLHRPDESNGARASALHDRICSVVEGLSFRELAECTGLNAETIRRYVRGADPSVAFIARLCEVFDLSAEWLLFGRGPRDRADAVEHALRSAGYGRLLAALADRLDQADRNGTPEGHSGAPGR
ncbi:MAG: helix-turn-helix domain-containing protein [Phycisphaerales bacterium]